MFAPLYRRGRNGSAGFAVGGAAVLLALAACGGETREPVTISQAAAVPGEVAQLENSESAGSATGDADNRVAAAIGASHDTATTAGHYLAARQALYFNDVGQSADFFLRTLEDDASNVALLRQAFLTQYYYGDIEQAAALGRQLEGLNVMVPLGGEPASAHPPAPDGRTRCPPPHRRAPVHTLWRCHRRRCRRPWCAQRCR